MITWFILAIVLTILVLVILLVIRSHSNGDWSNDGILIGQKDRTPEVLEAVEATRSQVSVLQDSLEPVVRRTDKDIGWLVSWAKKFGRDRD